jgi:hypothetical protein
MENTGKQQTINGKLFIYEISGITIKPPLGLMPKEIYERNIKIKRLNAIRGAIARYYDAGMKIKIEWIEEYNELIECVGEHC